MGMKLNIKKTNYLLIARNFNRPSYNYSSNLHICIDNVPISKTLNPTLLGIMLDPGLTFKPHFQEVRKKCASKINLIKTLSSKYYNINTLHLLTIYKSLVLSLLQYSMLPFIVASKETQNTIQLIQNFALKKILRLRPSASTKSIHTLCRVELIADRIKRLASRFLSKSVLHNVRIKQIVKSHESSNCTHHRSILDNISRI
jgi:hypothetical protein